MPKILITGGTGLIGRRLGEILLAKGYEVAMLSSSSKSESGITTYRWDVANKKIDPGAVAGADCIIHLAGASIDRRWTLSNRIRIINSRVKSGLLLLDAILNSSAKPRAFISASAVGYYGTLTSDKIFSETDEPAKDFLGETCNLWESVTALYEKLGIRTVVLRTGIVLAPDGGALRKISLPARLGIGSPLGSGLQYMPWIHIDDVCAMYCKAIEDVNMRGAYNAVAPEHVTNGKFMERLCKAMNKPFRFPAIPSFMLKMVFGDMSSILLKGSRVSSDKITAAGFSFTYPLLDAAFAGLLKK